VLQDMSGQDMPGEAARSYVPSDPKDGKALGTVIKLLGGVRVN
jgi:hypothetical protein